jgi:hypothetical protein
VSDAEWASRDIRLRMRLWIDGELSGETLMRSPLLDAKADEKINAWMESYLDSAKRAEAAGSVWMIEICDPSKKQG